MNSNCMCTTNSTVKATSTSGLISGITDAVLMWANPIVQ